jgi:tetratricopeptide (TPR) repeat protein
MFVFQRKNLVDGPSLRILMQELFGNERARTRWVVVFACLILHCSLPVRQSFGAPAEKGTIFGTVRSQSGAVIRDAKVTLKAVTPSVTAETLTQRDGTYTFADVNGGVYVLNVESPGFEKAEHPGVEVEAGQRTQVDFALRPNPSPNGLVCQENSSPNSGALSGSYYDEGSFKQSPLTSSGEAAGYSTGAQAEVSRRLLEESADMRTNAGSSPSDQETTREIRKLLQQEDSARLHQLLGKEKVQEGDFVAGAKEYERAAQMEPNESNLFNWGNTLLLQNAYQTALEVFFRGLQNYPRSPRLQVGLGIAQYLRGQYDEAVRTLVLASDLDPSDARPYVFLGRAYSSATVSESTVVIERLRRFVQLQPQNAFAHYYCALGLWKSERRKDQEGSLDEIESLLKRALALKPELTDAHVQLGAVYEERQMPHDAIDQYQQATNLQPSLAVAHYRLAELYLRAGEKARASQELALYESLHKQEGASQSAKPQQLPEPVK